MNRIIVAASLAGIAATAGCTATDPAERLPYTERDSAGVTIVENQAWDDLPTWTVAPEPSLMVGGMDAPDAQQFFRLTGAVRLADGRVAVSNAGTHEIRILGPDGTVLALHGKEGEGPGEFMDMDLLGLLAEDSLAVWDQELQRLSVVHVDEGVLRSYQVEWNGAGFPFVRGLLADGSLAVGGGMSFSSEEGFPTGVIRPPSTFGWVTPAGEEVHIGDFPAAEMFARASNQGFMARGLPFGRSTTAAAADDGLWVGTGEAYEVRFFGGDGSVERILRLQAPRRPVSDADVEAYIRVNVDEDTPDENRRRELRAMTREMPIPDFLPPYQGLLVDTRGNLWIQDYQLPESPVSAWTVFDAEGHVLARVDAPPRTELLEVGEGYLLGRTRDEFDVEALSVWSLTRSGA